MRAFFTALFALAVSMGTLIDCADEHNALAAAEGAPEQRTTVRGTPPADLEGRWLTVAWIKLPNQQGIATTLGLWEITREGDQLVLKEPLFGLPAAQQEAFKQALDAKQMWQPSAEDIAQVADAWGAGPQVDPQLATIESEIIGRDGFDDALKNDAKTRDAVWVVRQRQDFRPGAAHIIRQILVYSALETKDGGYVGNFSTGTVAAAPLPIPFAFDGTFRAYRLGAAHAPAPGFLARLLDFFAGCERR